jgi:lysophospholipase L1-like esterase
VRIGLGTQRRAGRAALAGVVILASALTAAAPADAGNPGRGWVGTWATGLTSAGDPPVPIVIFENQTLRQTVHTSIAGSAVRIRLSNEFGTEPLVIGEVHVARRAPGAPATEIVPGTDRRVNFSGKSSIVIHPGAPALSDPVPLAVPALSDLAISIFFPERTRATTLHSLAFQQNHAAPGNLTGAIRLPADARVNTQWNFLSAVSVLSTAQASAVVAFGDSITDGDLTTHNANRRWPDVLARRLHAAGMRHLGVLNKGIAAGRLLRNGATIPGTPGEGFGPRFGQGALGRFDRDVLSQPGVRYVIVMIGINDIGIPGVIGPASEAVTADDMIAGYRQVIARSREHGLTVIGGTLLPMGGSTIPGYDTPGNEAIRQAVNTWIRTSGEYDAVIDFDQAIRDPAQPSRMLPAYDCGDGLHPNDAGMQVMGDLVPLRLFRGGYVRAA